MTDKKQKTPKPKISDSFEEEPGAEQARIIRQEMMTRSKGVGTSKFKKREVSVWTFLRIIIVFTVMLFRNFSQEEHVGLRYDNIMNCLR